MTEIISNYYSYGLDGILPVKGKGIQDEYKDIVDEKTAKLAVRKGYNLAADLRQCRNKFIVIDIDMKPGQDGLSSFLSLLDDCALDKDLFTNTPKVKTPNNGFHLYFKAPEKHKVYSKDNVLQHVDVRSNLGTARGAMKLLCIPPSSVKSNQNIFKKYEWADEKGLADVAEIPTALLEKLEQLTATKKNKNAKKKGSGSRNNECFLLACRFRDEGKTEDVALAEVKEFCSKRFTEPLDDKELETLVTSAFKYDTSLYKQPLTMANLKSILTDSLNVHLSYNLISHRVESSKGTLEDARRSILDFKQQQHMKADSAIITTFMVGVAKENKCNPILDAIKATEWDESDRLPGLYNMLGVDDTFQQNLLQKWLQQCIAMLYNADVKNPVSADGVLVIQGQQGIGKTSFFRKIANIVDNECCFAEGRQLNMDVKDSIMQAVTHWIVELGELDGTLKRKQDSLKAFLTSNKDEYRLPYATFSESYNRVTSFCGTVNSEDYLKDPTGNRRYWTIHSDLIDLDGLNSLERDDILQLWAQVHKLYLDNPDGFRLTCAEHRQLAKVNADYRRLVPYETDLEQCFNWSQSIDDWRYFSIEDVVEILKDRLHNEDIKTRAVGRALTALMETKTSMEKRRFSDGMQYLLPTDII